MRTLYHPQLQACDHPKVRFSFPTSPRSRSTSASLSLRTVQSPSTGWVEIHIKTLFSVPHQSMGQPSKKITIQPIKQWPKVEYRTPAQPQYTLVATREGSAASCSIRGLSPATRWSKTDSGHIHCNWRDVFRLCWFQFSQSCQPQNNDS